MSVNGSDRLRVDLCLCADEKTLDKSALYETASVM
jgi:hypothetical protein